MDEGDRNTTQPVPVTEGAHEALEALNAVTAQSLNSHHAAETLTAEPGISSI